MLFFFTSCEQIFPKFSVGFSVYIPDGYWADVNDIKFIRVSFRGSGHTTDVWGQVEDVELWTL